MKLIRLILSILLILSVFQPCYAEEQELSIPILAQANGFLEKTLFMDISFGAFDFPQVDINGEPVLGEDGQQLVKDVNVPFVVVILILGAIYFTLYFGFINLRGFKHSVEVIAGRYDKEEDKGDVSHFKALTSALSATVGLGNIAGVAIAIQMGGPGAALWMIVTAFFGMSSKFTSCTLSQLYRKVNANGNISGGPMYYLDLGFKKFGPGLASFGKFLAYFYAVVIMLGALGGGNMFQANQTVEAFNTSFGVDKSNNLYLGLIIAFFVGLVVIGGVKRIGSVTSKVVPLMCVIYICAGLFVVYSNFSELGAAIQLMFNMAFTQNAFVGGFVGVLVAGIQRASFSNEAGLGSAAIMHAAAKTDEPVREGIVAMIGPFIDTMLICFMTAMVVIITGTWSDPEILAQGTNIGVTITSAAFATALPWFPKVLTICICLFAYSTMISWCYYGERGWIYLFDNITKEGVGAKSVIIYRIVFVLTIIVGATNSLSDVITFTDIMLLSLAVPNIIGCIFLAPQVKQLKNEYMEKLKAGKFSVR